MRHLLASKVSVAKVVFFCKGTKGVVYEVAICDSKTTGLETTGNQLLENGPETTRKRKLEKTVVLQIRFIQ